MDQMEKYWNEKMESMPLDQLKEIQLKRLKRIIKYVYEKNKFYKEKLKKAGVELGDVKSLKNIEKIPFLTKDDLRNYYPFGLMCVPMSEVVEVHASSGTTGKPVVGPYTKKDIEIWREVMARSLWANGLRKKDIMQNAYGYGLFTGAHGHELGAKAIGALTIPMSSGNTKRQLRIMKDFGATALATTPSYALYMGEVAEKEGYNLEQFELKLGFLGAEPWSEGMRNKIEDKWGMRACEQYGLTEIIGPGVSLECEFRNGMHINADHFLTEIVDPKTGEVLGEEEKGELVFTTLTKEAFPAIRFRTGDIASYTEEECDCGRTLPRHSRILGRADDRMKIKGVLAFPSQIEEAIMEVKGASENYQILKYRGMGGIKVEVEPSAGYKKGLDVLRKEIEEEIYTILNVKVPVEIVKLGSLPRSEGKAKKVVEID